MTLDLETCKRAPKVLLHDHLDGGLRPETMVELAAESGYAGLPTTDPVELGRWFRESADSGSLVRYLETFAHTVGVMQSADALRRVARECAEDLAADGVVYAEVRFAPELHIERGSDPRGGRSRRSWPASPRASRRRPRPAGRSSCGPCSRPCAPRPGAPRSPQRVVAYRDAGVVGFDIAGAEEGYPPTRHLDAFEYLRRENAHFTIHAGEAFGLPSIWEAIQWCGAERLGHGVHIMDDITREPDGSVHLGALASYIRDRRVPLEMCPSSNVQTGAAHSIATHPIGLLRTLGFRVTVNTDNRLMSGTSMSKEMHLLSEAFGYGLADLQWLTVNAMKSSFLPFDQRLRIINEVIKPGYASMALSDMMMG